MAYHKATIEMIAEHLRWHKDDGNYTTLLIGAGMSQSAGIPLASGIMEIIEAKYGNNLKRCKEKSYPEYMKCLPKGSRKDLIGGLIDKAKINLAHLYLATLVKEGYIDSILTTNFDGLAVYSLALHNILPAVYDMAACSEFDAGGVHYPAVFYLHGQKNGFVLLNTQDEVNRHSERLKNVFQEVAKKRCWIVIGYSGENDPVFKRLAEIGEYDYNLYWVGYMNEEPGEHVRKHILHKENTYYVKGHDADSFFIELSKALDLPKPQIIEKPFSHLKESIQMIGDYEKANRVIDLTKEVKSWIETAIKGFEEGKGFDQLEKVSGDAIDAVNLVRRVKDLWIYRKYNELAEVTGVVLASENMEAKQYLAYAYFEWGLELGTKHKYAEALEKYQQSIQITPTAIAFNNLGNMHWNLAQYAQAIEYYNEALKLKPEYADAWNNLGIAHGSLQQYDRAIECYTRALELKPEYAEAWNNMGYTHDEQAQYVRAIECFMRAVELKPEYADAWNGMAHTYCKTAEYEKAINGYTQTLRWKPADPDIWNNLGQAYSKRKDYENAKAAYSRAVELNPDYPYALDSFGELFYELQQYDEAISYYMDAIRHQPNFAISHANLGILFSTLNQPTQALEYFKTAIKLQPAMHREITAFHAFKPEEYAAWGNLAQAYECAGESEIAAECQQRCEELRTLLEVAS